jgi:hypothetical protein
MKHAFAGAVLMVGLLAAAAPAAAQDARAGKCHDCPKPRGHYDSQEIVRTSRDVDRSRVINTQSEVVVGRRVKETNHLIIRENQTRDVGVVRHNHTIYEVSPRYVVRVPRVTVVNYVTQRYQVVEMPATHVTRQVGHHVNPCSRGGRYGTSRYANPCRRVLRVRG